MSRPLRIEYENAWYHVMNRGARKLNIFHADRDRQLFLELLRQVHEKFQVEIHAYCLMNNHYHLLLKTPLANLSKAMKHLDGIYGLRYNKIHKIDGPLFRGRFKSIIVDAENYLLGLSRYIHLNPVKGKLINKAEAYPWSSCAAYFDEKIKPSWLQTSNILEKFGNRMQKEKYRLFVEEKTDDELDKFFSKTKHSPILGADEFVKIITERYLKNKELSSEITDQNILYNNKKPLLVSLNKVMMEVAKYYNVSIDILKTPTKGKNNIPRSVGMYLAKQMTGQNLQSIANEFTNITYSGVSRMVGNIDHQLSRDVNLRTQINRIKDSLLKQSKSRCDPCTQCKEEK